MGILDNSPEIRTEILLGNDDVTVRVQHIKPVKLTSTEHEDMI